MGVLDSGRYKMLDIEITKGFMGFFKEKGHRSRDAFNRIN